MAIRSLFFPGEEAVPPVSSVMQRLPRVLKSAAAPQWRCCCTPPANTEDGVADGQDGAGSRQNRFLTRVRGRVDGGPALYTGVRRGHLFLFLVVIVVVVVYDSVAQGNVLISPVSN